MHQVWRIVFCFLAGTGIVLAADPAPAEKTGLTIGEKAPNFQLKDQNGTEQTLAQLRKETPVALVFFRSASW